VLKQQIGVRFTGCAIKAAVTKNLALVRVIVTFVEIRFVNNNERLSEAL
jgi:hypothetical protein